MGYLLAYLQETDYHIQLYHIYLQVNTILLWPILQADVHMKIGDSVTLNHTEYVVLLPMWYGIQECKRTTASMDVCAR